MRRVAVLLALVAIACASSAATIGPLTLKPPEGWLVTDREAGSIKVTNGTIGDAQSTKAGTATAVFDVFVGSDQTLSDYRTYLRENNIEAKQDRIEVDGYDAVVVLSETTGVDPSMEVVFVPEWDVRIVYRAAYPDAEAAFERHRDEFRQALRSITFEGRPPDRA
jgi:hypothetical protein